MARLIKVIQAEILTAVASNAVLSGLTSTSKTAIYRLWSYIVASSIWALEVLFDAHKTELSAIVAAQKPHSLRWYVAKTKAFQYGSALPEGSDVYDNSTLSDGDVLYQQIIEAAAAVESNGRILIKAATLDGAALGKLNTPQYNALKGYLTEIKDAGVKFDLISQDGDRFRMTVDIFYNPQVLAPDGSRLDGTNDTPVKTVIAAFLHDISFNALFVKSKMTDALQLIDGVVVPEIRSVQAARFDVVVWQPIDVFYQPYSGWLKFYDATDLVINYIAV